MVYRLFSTDPSSGQNLLRRLWPPAVDGYSSEEMFTIDNLYFSISGKEPESFFLYDKPAIRRGPRGSDRTDWGKFLSFAQRDGPSSATER